MKRNTKIYLMITILTGSLVVTGSVLLANNKNTSSFNATGLNPGEWVHYAKREPTQSLVGIREYWVKCGGGYQFSEPTAASIKEAKSYDTSGFTTDDPRYIKYIENSKSVFYNDNDKAYDFTEVSQLAGYSTKNIPTELGEETRVEFYKNDNSPMYSCNCTRVTDVISSNSDISDMQTIMNVQTLNGYYVFTADLANTSTYISSKTAFSNFTGTIDGRNHKITNPSFWGHRMLGQVKDSVIKNLTFDQISVFSTLATSLTNTLLENVNFYTKSSLHSYSNVGMVCDYIYGSTKFKDCYIDYGENYLLSLGVDNHLTAPIACANYTNKDNDTFENFTIRCLPSVNIFLQDYYGRSLRPTDGVTYVSSFYFKKNSTLNYDIKYVDDNGEIEKAATKIKEKIGTITGKTITLNTISSSDVIAITSPSIVIGSSSSLENAYINVPSNDGEYIIKTVGKAIYIYAHDDYAYQTAALAFLSKAFGYDYLGKGPSSSTKIESNTVSDINNIDSFNINIDSISPFKYRRCDWGDAGFFDEYEVGYNCAGYTGDDVFFDVGPADPDDPYLSGNQRFHTTLHLLYPGTYYSSHKKWFALGSDGKVLPKTNNSYYTWQLCFTAQGDSTEYNSMVNEMANNIETAYNSRSNKAAKVLNVGIGDSRNYCHCSTCQAKTSEYGAISGTLIKFLNDVRTKLDAKGLTDLTISTFAYLGYVDAPVKYGSPTIYSSNPIMLAPIDANFTKSIGNSSYNNATYTSFENWAKVGKLYSWLYETNFLNYLYPYNSFKGMFDSIKYMASKGVEMAYIQGQHNVRPQYRTGFNQLKLYLDAKVMNDINIDYNSTLNSFFANYYGAGGTKMRTFFNELVTRMDGFSSDICGVYATINKATYWNKTQLESWVSLCNDALSLVSTTELKNRIKAESLFPRFALCTLFDSSYSSSTLLSMRQEFKTIADSLNVIQTAENSTTYNISNYYTAWGIA